MFLYLIYAEQFAISKTSVPTTITKLTTTTMPATITMPITTTIMPASSSSANVTIDDLTAAFQVMCCLLHTYLRWLILLVYKHVDIAVYYLMHKSLITGGSGIGSSSSSAASAASESH